MTAKFIVLETPPNHLEHPDYITVTQGMRNHFAVHIWWNPDQGGFWEPYDTGMGRYDNKEDAEEEAEYMAKGMDLPLYLPKENV